MKIKTILTLLAAVLVVASSWAQQIPAEVTVWARHYGGSVVYTYSVKNLGQRPISRFWIGMDIPDKTNGFAELTIAPKRINSTFWLSPDVGQSPAGWGVKVDYPEESSTFSLEWIEASYFAKLWPSAQSQEAPQPASGVRTIQPGAPLGGFVAVLPQEDLAYVRGHAMFSTDSGFAAVPLTRGDTSAPSIVLNVSRLNQNDTKGEWAIFKVAYDVSDNYDPLPTTDFQLFSTPAAAPGDIVADKNSAKAWNVKLRNVPGRVYTFRVQSADASGNVATQSYTYSVAQAR